LSRVLALDTSTRWGGAALIERRAGGAPGVVAEIGLEMVGSHADRILARVEWLLAEAGWTRAHPEAYVATRGPGSFTGIRVALGTVRGLALASGRPGAGVGSLDAIAEAVGPSEGPRLAVMDAGRGELYVRSYDPAASPPVATEAPRLLARSELRELAGVAVVVPGPGSALSPEELPAGARLARAPRSLAAAAGAIALLVGAEALGEASLAPLYVRAPDALVKPRR
jgi:tRNA threonylcarbamoyladenosine biosynthesis protein TsaB